jgi:hypothetical protein
MSQSARKRETEKYTVYDELIDISPIFAKDFLKLYGFPSTIDKINRGLRYIKITGFVTINTPTLTSTYEIEEMGVKNNKVYVDTKISDWETAKSEVKLLRSVKRRAYLLTQYDKPHIRIYLGDYDEITFSKGDNYDD